MITLPMNDSACCFTYETLAAFCDVSVDVVKGWKQKRDISHSKIGGHVTFTLEDVAEFRARHHVLARGLKPGESKAFWMEEARKFLGMREAGCVWRELDKVKERMDALDARFTAISNGKFQISEKEAA